jgi:urease accessory protein
VNRGRLFIALLALSGEAAAHGSVKGLGNFSNGFLHPLIEPTHLISLVALGLVIGQRGLERSEPAASCFAAGSVAGLALAGFGWTLETEVPLLAIAALAGILVATSATLPRLIYGVGAALFGLGIGLGSRPELASGSAMIATLVGAGLGANVWMLNVVALVMLLKRPWLLILVRVVGSWASASAILVLALWISGRHAPVPSGQPGLSSESGLQLDTRR